MLLCLLVVINKTSFLDIQSRMKDKDKYFNIKECLSRCGNVVIDIENKNQAEKILYSFLNSRKNLIEN